MKILLGLLFALSLVSCKKENNTDNDCNWMCNDMLVLDSLQIRNNLTGTWLWKRSNGGLAGETCQTASQADRVVTLTFASNGTYIKIDNGQQTTGIWQLTNVDPDMENKVWGISAAPEDWFTYNPIPQFCSNIRLYLVSNYFIIADGGTGEYEKQ